MPIIGVIASSAKGAPAAPVSVSATDVGTARAYNNGAATVSFTPGAGATATSFTATSSPGGFTATGASSPLTVTGLQSSVSYTFTVTATNASGTSPASSASNSITATTVPQAPTIGTATAGNTQATVTFTGNATGGKAISTYTATSSPGSITGASATSPITVTGLTNGTGYTFTVTATNANGTSTASAASNSITPVAPNYWLSQSTNTTIVNNDIFADSTNTRNVIFGWYGSGCYVAPFSNTGTLSTGKFISGITMWSDGATHVDSSGNIYLAGYSDANLMITVLKFNSSLVLQWQRKFGSNTAGQEGYGLALTTDSSGGVYLGGNIRQGNFSSPPFYGGFIAKWNSSGTLQWQKRASSGRYSAITHLHFDGTNIIAAGYDAYNWDGSDYYFYYPWVPIDTNGNFSSGYYKTSALNDVAFQGTRLYANGANSYQYASYNTNSTTVNWRRATGVGDFANLHQTADSSNNAYFVGQYQSNYQIVKFDSSGNTTWQRRITSPSTTTALYGVGIGQAGQVITAGEYQATVGSVNRPLTYFSLNPDGSGTGTYTVNGRSFTYEASSLTITTPSAETVATYGWSNTTTSYTETAGTATVSDYTITAPVTGIS